MMLREHAAAARRCDALRIGAGERGRGGVVSRGQTHNNANEPKVLTCGQNAGLQQPRVQERTRRGTRLCQCEQSHTSHVPHATVRHITCSLLHAAVVRHAHGPRSCLQRRRLNVVAVDAVGRLLLLLHSPQLHASCSKCCSRCSSRCLKGRQCIYGPVAGDGFASDGGACACEAGHAPGGYKKE